MRLPDILHIKGFRDLWLGQAISQLGDALYYVSFMFMAKKVTGQDEIVGFVGAMESLPFLLFGPFAGVMVDRFDRRKIMLLSDLACASTLLAFAGYVLLTGKPALWTLLVVPFLLSTMRVFFMPAKTASIPNLVSQRSLLAANSLSAATFNLMFMLGLALSAGVIAKLYSVSPNMFFFVVLALNGMSFLGSAVYIRRLPRLKPDRTGTLPAPLDDFRLGLKFIRSRMDLKVYIGLLTAFRFAVGPFFVVYVATNDQWFGGKPETLMWFEFAFFAGMIGGTAWISKFRVRRPGMFFSWGLAIVGLTVLPMAFCQNWLWGFVLWNLIAGIAVPFADVPMITYLQSSVDDAFRGRVNSVREMISVGVMPISMASAGWFVQTFGLMAAYLIMGGIMVVACLAGLAAASFREATMPLEEPRHAPDAALEPAGAA